MDKPIIEKRIPITERRRLRDKRIKSLYKKGFSMSQICMELGVSKTTVFLALNRSHATGTKGIYLK